MNRGDLKVFSKVNFLNKTYQTLEIEDGNYYPHIPKILK